MFPSTFKIRFVVESVPAALALIFCKNVVTSIIESRQDAHLIALINQ
jgi:hypothetical protein